MLQSASLFTGTTVPSDTGGTSLLKQHINTWTLYNVSQRHQRLERLLKVNERNVMESS